MSLDTPPAYAGFRSGRVGQAYNEAAFKHFLAVDRRRAERSKRSLLLVLVALQRSPGKRATLSEATAAALFAGLGECVREVDFVGWYREGQVAGAALAQPIKAPVDAQQRMTERLVHELKKRLTPAQFRNLRVRVIRLGARVRM